MSDSATVRCFDHFEVDLENRQLYRDGRLVRLQEKPFQLLEALLARAGRTVTREELRGRLWPDARHLDFDASLNAAARKLRRALGDSAQEPRWLVTVPGRGYRLVASPQNRVRSPRPGDSRRGILTAIAASLVVAAALVVFILLAGQTAESSGHEVVRLAIMPFELAPTEGPPRADLAPISDWLVAEMAGAWRLHVVGPRTTAPYTGKPFPDMSRLAADYRLDYVLNARTLRKDESTALLVELIRLNDGDHSWVELFEELGDWQAVASAVRDGLVETLDLEAAR